MVGVSLLDGFAVDEADISFVGRDLRRPECILAFADGTLITSHPQGVLRIDPDGAETIRGDLGYDGFEAATSEAQRYGTGSLPTGIALLKNGDIIVANFGLNRFERIGADGSVS